MADGSGFLSPLRCVVTNLLIFEVNRWVISDIIVVREDQGREIIFLSEVILWPNELNPDRYPHSTRIMTGVRVAVSKICR